MKKILAAVLAAAAAITLTACSKQPAASGSDAAAAASQTVSQSASQSAAASAPSSSQQTAPQASSSQQSTLSWEDKTYTGDVEEAASYSFALPQFTCSDQKVADKLNEYYQGVADKLVQYTQADVYQKAQELGAVGLLSGDYTAEEQDGSLTVTCTLSVSYAGSAETDSFSRTDTFSTATGACTASTEN